jgi:hypothetical protein
MRALSTLTLLAILLPFPACTKPVDPDVLRRQKMKFHLPALGKFHIRPLYSTPPKAFNDWQIVRYEFWASELADVTVSLNDPRTNWEISDNVLCESNKSFVLTCGFKRSKRGSIPFLDFNEKAILDPGPDEDYDLPPKEARTTLNAGFSYLAIKHDTITGFVESPLGAEFILSSWAWRPPTRSGIRRYSWKKTGPGARQAILVLNKTNYSYEDYPYPYWELTLEAMNKKE